MRRRGEGGAVAVTAGDEAQGAERLTVDARGLACPLPVLRLAAAARGATTGTVVTVLWTDPAAAYDVPAWVRMRGHRLVEPPRTDEDGTGRAVVRLVGR